MLFFTITGGGDDSTLYLDCTKEKNWIELIPKKRWKNWEKVPQIVQACFFIWLVNYKTLGSFPAFYI